MGVHHRLGLVGHKLPKTEKAANKPVRGGWAIFLCRLCRSRGFTFAPGGWPHHRRLISRETTAWQTIFFVNVVGQPVPLLTALYFHAGNWKAARLQAQALKEGAGPVYATMAVRIVGVSGKRAGGKATRTELVDWFGAYPLISCAWLSSRLVRTVGLVPSGIE